MPGIVLSEMEVLPEAELKTVPIDYGFVVSHQVVELDIDFSTKSLTGRTVITIEPLRQDLRSIRIDARQCIIPKAGVRVTANTAEGSAEHAAEYLYEDPSEKLHIPSYWECGIEQHALQKSRVEKAQEEARTNGALLITVPKTVHIIPRYDVAPYTASTNRLLAVSNTHAALSAADASAIPTILARPKEEPKPKFEEIRVIIEFSIPRFQDGLHFVGLDEGDARFPHVYTQHSVNSGTASCIFPCVDDAAMRCTWQISITCYRTLGDALKKRHITNTRKASLIKLSLPNGKANGYSKPPPASEYVMPLSEEEKLLEMAVICSGQTVNEVLDSKDALKKTTSFICDVIVAPRHIGFAIGPFEAVDLSEYREEEDGEKLGQEQSIAIFAYCLPGRSEEIRHTCSPVTLALDWITMKFGRYPFKESKLVFIEDQLRDTEHVASMSLCSTRLLFDESLIDPEDQNIRILVHAITSQWFGVAVVPEDANDRWITIGLSQFITGLFMKELCGNNDYMFRQKTLSDRLVEQDNDRPSIYKLGESLHLGKFEYDFMALKSQLVMFILDKRIIKAEGSAGLSKLIRKLIDGADSGRSEDSIIDTKKFQRACEKVAKYRQTESFFNQWVKGAGCPRFSISQRFNKKRLCVEMTISQKQDTVPIQRPLEKSSFMREFKEEVTEVFAEGVQPVFTGSLTIRIHEADGTPYEHIVDIREGLARIEIPYNTKYKRLKRNRRHRERQTQGMALDPSAETPDDVLYYCLGDVLQSPQEMQEWGLVDWDPDTEARMDQESYEWIRIDADFEWLCEKTFVSMPAYMYVSQLQQDRDVVAQQESMMFLSTREPHPLVSTFLIRTLMDSRYFHGIRTMAAAALRNHATPSLNWVGFRQLEKAFQELFCYPGTRTPRPNDFTDKRAYNIEKSIPSAIAQVRGHDGRCPKHARQFILDQLRFNDNGNNEYSDTFKVVNLLSALANSLIPMSSNSPQIVLSDGEDEEEYELRKFTETVVDELDRHRRIDEWTNSYHNIYTTTVLDCKRRLMRAKIIPTDPLEFAQYLHDGTSDFVRVKAFESLMDLGFIRNDSVATLLMNVLSTDSSTYVRGQLFGAFYLALATVALDEVPKLKEPAVQDGEFDALVVDQDVSMDDRRLQMLRTSTITGAINSLKEPLGSHDAFKEAVWKAIKSQTINMAEQLDLLDTCGAIFEQKESLVIRIPYPRYWEAKKVGKGKLVFTKNVRTTSKKKKALMSTSAVMPAPSLRLSLNAGLMKPPKRPHPPERTPSILSDGEPARKIIKLKVHHEKLAAIQRSIPQPAFSQVSNLPASKKPSTVSTTPAPPLIVESPSHNIPAQNTSSSMTPAVKVRKPLPDGIPKYPLTEHPGLAKKASSGIKIKFKPSSSPTD